MILHRPLRTGPLSSLFFLFSLSLPPSPSLPNRLLSSHPCIPLLKGRYRCSFPRPSTGADFMACLGAIPGHKRGSDSNRFRGEQRHSPSLHWIRNRHEILLPSSLFRDSSTLFRLFRIILRPEFSFITFLFWIYPGNKSEFQL